jgi:CTD small phosphatase-like protein 2
MNYNKGFNTNTHFVSKRNTNNNNVMRKERNSVNNFEIRNNNPLENYNYIKYNEIYDITMNNNKNMYIKKNILSLNLEELIILEEKLCEIIIEFKRKKKAENQCFDFWNYYFNFSLYQKIEKFFLNEIDEEIIRLSINYELMSILLCYVYSLRNENSMDYSLYIEILQLCHRNLTLILEQVLNETTPETQNNILNNIWIMKIKEIVQYSKNSSEQIFSSENYISSLIGKINFNTNCLIKKIKNIIYNSYYDNKQLLNDFVRNLNQKTYEEINDFFRENIYKVDNYEGSILSSIIKPHININRECPPYIKEPNLKKYSLVLDLNETLINFKLTKGNQGLVRTRPFLFEFLENIGKFYEIILFTCSTHNYTDSIVKAIEVKKKYFDYIFCRQHTITMKNDFVKDLTRIGRPLDSIIIVDNMPQNFRLQKENGINIKSFWGDNSEDKALYDLIPILISIANEKIDVREGLVKYKDEIVKKITSNISKNDI